MSALWGAEKKIIKDSVQIADFNISRDRKFVLLKHVLLPGAVN